MIEKDPYYSIKAISNSSLKFIDPEEGGSPQKFKAFLNGELAEEKSNSLIRGTIIHIAMLEPHKYVVADIDKPSAELGHIADTILQQDIPLDDDSILRTIEAHNWQPRWKPETKVVKFKDSGAIKYIKYFREMENSGKIAMDKKTGEIVEACKTALEMNDQTRYILKEVETIDEEFEVFNEIDVQWTQTVNGVVLPLKCKIDRLIVDHRTKTYVIVDVKTTGKPISKFQISFEEYKYPRQVDFYDVGAKNLLKQKGLSGYKCTASYIAAVETADYHTAQLFDVTGYLGTQRDTIKSLLERLSYHYGSGDWVHSKEFIDGEGVIKLSPSI